MASELVTFADLQANLSTWLEDASTVLYSLEERKRALNASYAQLYVKAISLSNGQGVSQVKTTLSVVSGTDTIALPADFYRCINVWYEYSDRNHVKWKPIHPAAVTDYVSSISQSSKMKAFYFRGNSTMVVVPMPNESYSITMLYATNPVSMDADFDEPNFPMAHRELIVLGALKRLAQKEGMPLLGETKETYSELSENFVTDMVSMQSQSSRRLQGQNDYDQYSIFG